LTVQQSQSQLATAKTQLVAPFPYVLVQALKAATSPWSLVQELRLKAAV
jgi:hypothetical protein